MSNSRVLIGFGKANLDITVVSMVASRIEPPFTKALAVPTGNASQWLETSAGRLGSAVNGSVYSVECSIPEGTVFCF